MTPRIAIAGLAGAVALAGLALAACGSGASAACRSDLAIYVKASRPVVVNMGGSIGQQTIPANALLQSWARSQMKAKACPDTPSMKGQ